MNLSKSILIGAAALFVPFVGHAASITAPAAVNGLTFSNFNCVISSQGVAVTPSDCSSINVNDNAAGNGINITSGFGAAGKNTFSDVTITYHLDSSSPLDVVGLTFNGFFFGEAITSVSESVYSGGKQVGFALVACGSDAFKSGCNQSDLIALNGSYTSFDIVKDINLTAINGSASASVIGQTFALAPEPSSTAMLGGGLLAAAALLRRKLKSDSKQVTA